MSSSPQPLLLSITATLLVILLLTITSTHSETQFHLSHKRRHLLQNKANRNVLKPNQFKLAYYTKDSMHVAYHVAKPYSPPTEHRCRYAKNTQSTAAAAADIDPETLQWKDAMLVKLDTYADNAGTSATFRFVALEENSVYVYQCLDSEIYSFRTGDYNFSQKEKPTKMLWLGDLGSEFANNTVQTVRNRVAKEQFDSVQLVGDISYADGYSCDEYELVWGEFFREMSPVIATHPFMVIPGNHEYVCHGDGACREWTKDFVPYNSKFTMIYEPNKLHSMWYSFTRRNVHVIGISTETSYKDAPFPSQFGDQMTWLEETLRKANDTRDQVPWIVVMGHRPIYSSHVQYSKDGEPIGSALILQQAIEDLLFKYKVDMYICGHVHSYERTRPVYNNKLHPQGTVHAVIGHAGNPEGPTKESSYAKPSPEWSAFHFTKDEGYATMEVTNDQLIWRMHASSTDAVEDEVTLKRRF